MEYIKHWWWGFVHWQYVIRWQVKQFTLEHYMPQIKSNLSFSSNRSSLHKKSLLFVLSPLEYWDLILLDVDSLADTHCLLPQGDHLGQDCDIYSTSNEITLSSLFGLPSLSLIKVMSEHMWTSGKSSVEERIFSSTFRYILIFPLWQLWWSQYIVAK